MDDWLERKINSAALKSTDSVTQYCATATFQGDYFAYLCEPSPSWWWTVALTPQGQTVAPSGIPRFTGSNATAATISPQPGSKNVGAIAGGAVGGLIGLCLLLALAFLILKRRRSAAPPTIIDGESFKPAELSPVSVPAEMVEQGPVKPSELSPTSVRKEMDGTPAAELDGIGRVELNGAHTTELGAHK
jgi:hypothetical protein